MADRCAEQNRQTETVGQNRKDRKAQNDTEIGGQTEQTQTETDRHRQTEQNRQTEIDTETGGQYRTDQKIDRYRHNRDG